MKATISKASKIDRKEPVIVPDGCGDQTYLEFESWLLCHV
jgi:hypothetical protein